MASFSILSVAALWWLVREYEATPYGEKLWIMPTWWLWLKSALILFALILATGGLLAPNPSAPGAAKLLMDPKVAGGVFAITRHPIMWGVAIWAASHIVSQATLRGFLFFGALAATALIGSWLQQRRKRQSLPGWGAFEAKTSFVPFAAILEGRAKFSLKTIGWWQVAIAAILLALIVHFHYPLFGAQPLPVHT